jgi:hypothetical protein
VSQLTQQGPAPPCPHRSPLLLLHRSEASPFDLLLIAGDLSYATTDPPKNELQGFWDSWGRQNEPFSSTGACGHTVRPPRVRQRSHSLHLAPTRCCAAPWMTTVGNHEATPGNLTNASGTYPLPFAAFSARYVMPRNGNANYCECRALVGWMHLPRP